jgi:hypothetical protein
LSKLLSLKVRKFTSIKNATQLHLQGKIMKTSIRFFLFLLIILSTNAFSATANNIDPEVVKYYRDLTLRIRSSAEFKVPMIGSDQTYSYELKFADPVYKDPMVGDLVLGNDPTKFYRSFFDRIMLKDGSYALINGEQIPLTCIFINGQDNRNSGNTDPRFPQFIMKVYLVANDFSCVGPINPGFPSNGGKEEAWDTYLYFEVRDPTIMLPVEAKIRYRWNEFHSVLVK